MSKYKVGDVVVVVDNINGHGFPLGEVAEVTETNPYGLGWDHYLVKVKTDFGELSYVLEDCELSEFEDEQDEPDMVNSPAHYGTGSIECIEYIEDFLTTEEYIGYLRGNIAKYLHRWRRKGKPVEDLSKARWYLDKLIEKVEYEK